MNAPDFSGIDTGPASGDHLQMLRVMVQTLREKQNAVADVEATLARLSADLKHFQLVVLPEAMELAGVADYGLSDGSRLTVKDDLKVSITKDNAPYAYDWFRKNGHGGVIKESLLVDLRSLEEKERDELRTQVLSHSVTPETIESVHPSTLKALVKELLEGGITPPPSISVYQFKKAELKEPKGKGK